MPLSHRDIPFEKTYVWNESGEPLPDGFAPSNAITAEARAGFLKILPVLSQQELRNMHADLKHKKWIPSGFQLRLSFGQESPRGKVPGSIQLRFIHHRSGPKSVVPSYGNSEINGTFLADIEGPRYQSDGSLDPSSVHRSAIKLARNKHLAAVHPNVAIHIDEVHEQRGPAVRSNSFGRGEPYAYVDFSYHREGGAPNRSRYIFRRDLKHNLAWKVERELKGFEVYQAHLDWALSPSSSPTKGFDSFVSSLLEREIQRRHPEGILIESDVKRRWNTCTLIGRADATFRMASGTPEKYSFLVQFKDNKWVFVRELSAGEKVDLRDPKSVANGSEHS